LSAAEKKQHKTAICVVFSDDHALFSCYLSLTFLFLEDIKELHFLRLKSVLLEHSEESR
jgi:hypothetical protein